MFIDLCGTNGEGSRTKRALFTAAPAIPFAPWPQFCIRILGTQLRLAIMQWQLWQ